MVLLDPNAKCRQSGCGPGYASPQEAIAKAPREQLLIVTCPRFDSDKPDAIMTVDVNPDSHTYSQIVGRLDLPYSGDEVHHTGWNACSSCHGDPNHQRSHLVAPSLNSSRIYFINACDPRNLKVDLTLEPDEMRSHGVSFPHTAHCLADGNIMISTLGDADGNGKGDFILIDSKTFQLKGSWLADGSKKMNLNYDFWYQPRQNVMIATEWGPPRRIKAGFDLQHVIDGEYGQRVHVLDWHERRLQQTIELEGATGALPLEVRFLHEPKSTSAFCGTALGSTIYHFYRPDGERDFVASKAIVIPAKRVDGWILPEMPALITDILISMDDRFLFCSCWLHGDIRQYDITDPHQPKLVGQLFLGGSVHTESGISVVSDPELKEQPAARYIKDQRVEGAPQMLQLSIDGQRLYVTTSLYSIWDKQFYPKLIERGAMMLQVNVDTTKGGLSLNENFLVDFGEIADGPFLAHEMRYPGGDCTSDIWS